MNILRKVSLTLAGLGCYGAVLAQANNGLGQDVNPEYNTITTAVPFMRISPDARSGAMGDVGIAISPDANAQYWNISKLALSDKEAGASITYTPWLKDLVNDIALTYVSGYMKFGEEGNKNQAVSASLKYFSLGDINYTDINAVSLGTGKPREFAFDLGYSRALSEQFSVGLAGKYIHSTLLQGAACPPGSICKPGKSFAVDFGVFYTKPVGEVFEDGESSKVNVGLAITNLGTKVAYSPDRKDFIPTNLGLGLAYEYYIDEFNKFTAALDLNKLMVPSPGREYIDSTDTWIQTYPTDKTVLSGMLGSFGDAPGGGSEELKEVMVGLGAEYSYQNQFFARAGYFYESKLKGDRKFFTVGLGVKYNVFGLNFAYLVPSGSGTNRNPLSNTLRFSLLFDFDNFSKIVKGKPKEKDDKNSGSNTNREEK